MLYNIPAVTGVNLDPATVRALAEEVDNIRYIKDSSANWEQALQLIHHHSDVIGTFIGWDVYIYSALVEGAAGVMAGTANVVPNEIVAVSRRIAEGDLTGALTSGRSCTRSSTPCSPCRSSRPSRPASPCRACRPARPGAPRPTSAPRTWPGSSRPSPPSTK